MITIQRLAIFFIDLSFICCKFVAMIWTKTPVFAEFQRLNQDHIHVLLLTDYLHGSNHYIFIIDDQKWKCLLFFILIFSLECRRSACVSCCQEKWDINILYVFSIHGDDIEGAVKLQSRDDLDRTLNSSILVLRCATIILGPTRNKVIISQKSERNGKNATENTLVKTNKISYGISTCI